jgi:Transcription factor Opi1
LIDVKSYIVHTIGQAVDIVSKYAGGVLPEPARTRVRGFILNGGRLKRVEQGLELSVLLVIVRVIRR